VYERWVLAGTRLCVPAHSTNKNFETLPEAQGVAAEDIMITYTPSAILTGRHLVSEIKRFGSAARKRRSFQPLTATPTCPFYREAGPNQGI